MPSAMYGNGRVLSDVENRSPTERRSVVLLGVQQCEGVADALFEEFVGELPVGQGAGELQCPGHHAEEAKGLEMCRGWIVGCQAGGEAVDEDECAVGVGLPGFVCG